jgi:hypothetical protein
LDYEGGELDSSLFAWGHFDNFTPPVVRTNNPIQML